MLRLLGLLGCLVVAGGGVRAGVADKVYEALQASRSAAGVVPLERRADLDRVARSRAERVAALPHRERLEVAASVGEELRQAGIEFRRVSLHLDLNRGYTDPAQAFVGSWSEAETAWSAALSEEFDVTGLGAARADDGWIVLAVVLLEEHPPRPVLDTVELESRTLQSVNRARSAQRLGVLEVDSVLVELARAHGRDMVRRRYFDHLAPDGTDLADRIRRRGLEYSRIGENLHRNAGSEDPVSLAVKSWLESQGHRELLLLPEFTTTGIGVVLDDESGTLYFTQIFLAPMPHNRGSGAAR
jgi:uncharacterized protein YkwD